MSEATATPAAPTAERTEAEIIREICVRQGKILMLQFELKRLRNPSGKTLADLEGIWADQQTSEAEIEASKFQFRAEPQTA